MWHRTVSQVATRGEGEWVGLALSLLSTNSVEGWMTIRLDHTIVPAKDKVASAKFFAEIFGLTVSGTGHFAPVQINESLTLDFADDPELSGGPKRGRSHHYAFHVSQDEFDAIFDRVKTKGIPYGSGPFNHTDGKLNNRRGGRGFYFEDPNGHLLEVMTAPETGSQDVL